MKKSTENEFPELNSATRQFRHNNDNSPSLSNPEQGFVIAYDRGETEKVIRELRAELDQLKQGRGEPIREFVNSMIGAFESGFVDSNTITLATLYQVMRNHCKDSFGENTPPIDVLWGKETAQACAVPPAPAAAPDGWNVEIDHTEYQDVVVTAPDGEQQILHREDPANGLLRDMLAATPQPDDGDGQ